MALALQMEHISKAFLGVQALDDVTLSVEQGEIHALVGENGAGKSTLIKILGGAYAADSGTICLHNEEIHIDNPRRSIELGIGIIYQELNLVPTLSAAENIFLGREIAGSLHHIQREQMEEKARELMSLLNMDKLDVTLPVSQLTLAMQQLVEIGKALSNKTSILIMDEPTAVLTERETEALFDIMERLKKQGISILFVSHRLEEIQRIADRITVLRDGKVTAVLDNCRHTIEKDVIVRYMVGRELDHYYPPVDHQSLSQEVLRVEGLRKEGMYENINFSLKKGEILGLSGLIGAGRTEVAMTLFGAFQKDGGEVFLEGRRLGQLTISKAIQEGIILVPEDRKGAGLVLLMDMADNVGLPNRKLIADCGVVRLRKKMELTWKYIRKLSIRPETPDRKMLHFSGGNQQKVVIAKWLATNPRVLILDEPTRGVDVGAKAELYRLMRELTSQGMSILFISSEMQELLGMCDRILVMHEGHITGEFDRGSMNQQDIMRAAAFRNL